MKLRYERGEGKEEGDDKRTPVCGSPYAFMISHVLTPSLRGSTRLLFLPGDVQKELKLLQGKDPLEGVHINIPDDSNIYKWQVKRSGGDAMPCVRGKDAGKDAGRLCDQTVLPGPRTGGSLPLAIYFYFRGEK